MKKKITSDENKVVDLENKLNEVTNNWKRALADYQNLDRRVRDEKEQFAKYAKVSLIEKILPALDNLENVNNHVKDKGLEISLKSLWDVLSKEGLKRIEALGKEFNPLTMHAIDTVNGGEKDKVIEVYQEGYMLNDKVIRPAQVRVGRGEEVREGNK